MTDTLLPERFLTGLRLGISVSASADLPRLGLREAHVRAVLGEIARVALVAGGKLAYGGHLDPEGYTPFLISELQRYGRRDKPLLVCLAWNEHRKLSLPDLRQRIDLGLLGTVVCLDADGSPTDPFAGRGEEPAPENDRETRSHALTGMRRYMGERIDARVLIGGKRSNFSGVVPGLMEEALLTLEARQPLYLAAGCGGVTVDIVRALGIDECAWLPPFADDESADPRLLAGRARLTELAASIGDERGRGLHNGLTDDENKRLARTPRAGEIAALVNLGLGRLGQAMGGTAV